MPEMSREFAILVTLAAAGLLMMTLASGTVSADSHKSVEDYANETTGEVDLAGLQDAIDDFITDEISLATPRRD